MGFRAITLHDKYHEEIIGTVLLKKNVDMHTVCNAWDEYQKDNNSNLDSEADIYEFANLYPELCENIELDFYQP